MKYVFADESWEDICIGKNGQKNAKTLKSAHKGYREKPLWRYRQTRSVKTQLPRFLVKANRQRTPIDLSGKGRRAQNSKMPFSL